MDTSEHRPHQPDGAAADRGSAPERSDAEPLGLPEPPRKQHGDALADGSGTRHGESPPRVEPDAHTS